MSSSSGNASTTKPKKAFDYSKWDHIELSDDEDDVHPNIDKESWFRMRHRSRVEREENEEKDKAVLMKEMKAANERIQILQREIEKIEKAKQQKTNADDDDDDDDDEDLDAVEKEGYVVELQQLLLSNKQRQNKLDEYEKNKKWNVDNMFEVKEERTIVNPNAAKESYSAASGYVEQPPLPTITPKVSTTTTSASDTAKTSTASKPTAAKESTANASTTTSTKMTPTPPIVTVPKPPIHNVPDTADLGAMATYHEFTEKYADVVEGFMACTTLDASKEYLLQYGNIVLCENASNYLLLASLEDEMNGYRDKMKITARQSQIVSNIAELAKTIHQHPGNVIQPFFQRLQERKHLEDFLYGVNVFVEKIIQRAIVKKAEIDAQRAEQQDASGDADTGGTSLHDIPKEQRLGPGGLDPLEVIETLPSSIVEAFESRDVEQLKQALTQLTPDEAEYHMQRCIDSGLWVANAGGD
jgi:cell division cycle protein 37